MKINQVAQSVQTQQITRKGRKTEAVPVEQKGDKVEISSEARSLSKSNDISTAATQALKDTPDVRNDKIAEIREKVRDGFYNQENISSAIADQLLKEFGI